MLCLLYLTTMLTCSHSQGRPRNTAAKNAAPAKNTPTIMGSISSPIAREPKSPPIIFQSLHYCPPDQLGDLGDDGVSECSKSVHPAANPISHSTHVGFRAPPAA